MRAINLTYLIFVSIVVFNSCEKPVYLGISEPEIIQNAKIFIDSKPTGANIYLNGKNMGLNTPDSITWLNSQVYSVKLTLPLYKDTMFYVETIDGLVKEVFVDFQKDLKNLGKLYCNSTPQGAKIFINDSITTKTTPNTFEELIPGNYKVKYTYPEHRPDSMNIIVSGAKTVFVNLTLEDTSKWVSYNTSNSKISDNYVTEIVFDNDNTLWVGTYSGLNSFDGKNWKHYTSSNSALKANIIYCLAVDSENKKWIGTPNGLFVYENQQWQDLSYILPDPYVKDIKIDSKKQIWIGTLRGLVKYYKGNTQVFNSGNSGLIDDFVTCLEVDNENKIWVGSVDKGISIYDDNNGWINFSVNDIDISGKYVKYIKSIFNDYKGTIWTSVTSLGGAMGAVMYYSNNRWNYFSETKLSIRTTNTFYPTENRILFGTTSGLGVLYDENIFKLYSSENIRFSSLRIETMVIDKYGNLWFGTQLCGLGKLKKGNF